MLRLHRHTRGRGQTLSEFGIVIALVAVLSILALSAMSGAVNGLFERVQSSLTGVSLPASPPPSPLPPPPGRATVSPQNPIQGQTVTIQADGFDPDVPVTIVLHSDDPRTLAIARSDLRGRVEAVVGIPLDATPGLHYVEAGGSGQGDVDWRALSDLFPIGPGNPERISFPVHLSGRADGSYPAAPLLTTTTASYLQVNGLPNITSELLQASLGGIQADLRPVFNQFNDYIGNPVYSALGVCGQGCSGTVDFPSNPFPWSPAQAGNNFWMRITINEIPTVTQVAAGGIASGLGFLTYGIFLCPSSAFLPSAPGCQSFYPDFGQSGNSPFFSSTPLEGRTSVPIHSMILPVSRLSTGTWQLWVETGIMTATGGTIGVTILSFPSRVSATISYPW